MVESKSTDKLLIVCNTAKEIISKNPEMKDKIKSISIIWKEIEGMAVPDINIEFYDKVSLNKGI